MDGWPRSWRSLAWLALAREAITWAVEKVVYQFDPRRRYPPW